jgi:transposase
MTTKILALTDALGNLVRFVLLPGHRFDTVGVAPLIDGLTFEGFIADKAFDSNSIIANLNERGAKIVISQHPRRASPLPIDAEIYKWRHLIENFFCKLKEFKRIAMRADKTDHSFAANILLAAAVINSRAMAKQVAPERHEICEVVATLLAHAGGMNKRTDSRSLCQLNDRYWQAVVA